MPLAVGASLMLLMLTWRQGTRNLAEVSKKDEVRLADFRYYDRQVVDCPCVGHRSVPNRQP
jgi:K+ transporter